MAEKDISEKYLEEYPDVFADIINVLLLGGDYISPEELYNGPTELKGYMSDYSIKVINVAYIPKQTREKLKSDFKVVADFFAEKRENNRYNPSYKELKHGMAVLNMLRVFTDDKRYKEIEELIKRRKEKGEVISMCTFADEMENKGISKGRVMEAIEIYSEEMHLHHKEILEKIIQKFGLSYEDAEKYLQRISLE